MLTNIRPDLSLLPLREISRNKRMQPGTIDLARARRCVWLSGIPHSADPSSVCLLSRGGGWAMIHSVIPETHRSGSPGSSACLPRSISSLFAASNRSPYDLAGESEQLGGSRRSTFCSPRKVGISPEMRIPPHHIRACTRILRCRFKAALLSAGQRHVGNHATLVGLAAGRPLVGSKPARGLIARFVETLRSVRPLLRFGIRKCTAVPRTASHRDVNAASICNAIGTRAKFNRDRESGIRLMDPLCGSTVHSHQIGPKDPSVIRRGKGGGGGEEKKMKRNT